MRLLLVMGAGCNGTTNGDNASASFQGGEPMASCSNGVNTVWYSFIDLLPDLFA
ncbi:MAG: hypothetical protein R3B93_03255 [Bacteroidia bacterium]